MIITHSSRSPEQKVLFFHEEIFRKSSHAAQLWITFSGTECCSALWGKNRKTHRSRTWKKQVSIYWELVGRNLTWRSSKHYYFSTVLYLYSQILVDSFMERNDLALSIRRKGMSSRQIYFFIKWIPEQETETFPLSSEGIILCPCHFLAFDPVDKNYRYNIDWIYMNTLGSGVGEMMQHSRMLCKSYAWRKK